MTASDGRMTIARQQRPKIEFDRITKSYDGRTLALGPVDLAVYDGEFLSLLGPSGSGKTTLLMALAGFEQPTTGEICLNGESIARQPPHRRNIGIVFQDYALFPHKSVQANVAYPLERRGIPKAAIRKRVADALEMVNLGAHSGRMPGQLSGGQRQRVAVARALVFDPDVVLMDEPLGALDRALRAQLLIELKQIHRRTGATFVYVTHDQEEALAISDRIAVFNSGQIVQVGTPLELYETPRDLFVAGFVGENNIVEGICIRHFGSAASVALPGGTVLEGKAVDPVVEGATVCVAIRPECISLLNEAATLSPRLNRVAARLVESTYLGRYRRMVFSIEGGTTLVVSADSGWGDPEVGRSCTLGYLADFCRVYKGPAS